MLFTDMRHFHIGDESIRLVERRARARVAWRPQCWLKLFCCSAMQALRAEPALYRTAIGVTDIPAAGFRTKRSDLTIVGPALLVKGE